MAVESQVRSGRVDDLAKQIAAQVTVDLWWLTGKRVRHGRVVGEGDTQHGVQPLQRLVQPCGGAWSLMPLGVGMGTGGILRRHGETPIEAGDTSDSQADPAHIHHHAAFENDHTGLVEHRGELVPITLVMIVVS